MRLFEASAWSSKGWYVCFVCLHLIGLGLYSLHLLTGWSLNRLLVEPFQLFNVYWNGVLLLIAFIFAYGLAITQPFEGWDDTQQMIFHRPLTILIVGLLGARLLDILVLSPVSTAQGIRSPADYFSNPILLFDLNWGGLNIWGAIGLIALWIAFRCWRKGGLLLSIFIKGVLGLLAGLSLMQWGHFLTQQFYGPPYNGIGAVEIDLAYRLPDLVQFSPTGHYFPLFLLGAVWYLLGALFMIFAPRWPRISMNLAATDQLLFGLTWFAVGRLGLEIVTPDSTVNGWFGLVLILLIFAVGLRNQSRHIGG